jgi:polysaccharide deacetylase family protein (PEP-CTERM system associated)
MGAAIRVLTVDLEDWFHLLVHPGADDPAVWGTMPSRLAGNTAGLLEVLHRAGARATFFVLGWVARQHPSVLRSVVAAGHELGCHSDVHTLVERMTPSGFREDLRRARASIEDAAGVGVRSYRAPGFSITPEVSWAFDVLASEGFQYDCSVFPGSHAHGGMRGAVPSGPHRIRTPHGEVLEFPVSTCSVLGRDLAVAGGGYFRLLPGAIVNALARRSPYLMTYFHPRDFDPAQPVLPGLSIARRARAYVGLRGALRKLESLLRLGGFCAVGDAARLVRWADRPIITSPLSPLGSARRITG